MVPASQAVDGAALRAMLAGRLSPRTERSYQDALRTFLTWAADTGDVDGQGGVRIDRDVAVRYRAWLVARYKPATVNHRLTTLRLLCDELVERDLMRRNPLARLKGLRLPSESPLTVLTRPQTLDLLAACRADGTPRGLRDLALVQLALWCGLRKAEILALTWGALGVQGEHQVLRFVAKGLRTITTKVQPPLLASFGRWRAALGRCLDAEPVEGGPIFVRVRGPRSVPADGSWPWTGDGVALSPTALDHIVAKRARQARCPAITPHCLRATHITVARELGAATHLIQHNVGHADARTTDRYDARRRNLEHHVTDYLGYLGAATADP